MIDRLRRRAAVIYLEGSYHPRQSAPSAEWTATNLKLGDGIATSRVDSSHKVTVSTIVLVDTNIYARLRHDELSLQFCREDPPGRLQLIDPEDAQGGQWMPLVRLRGMPLARVAVSHDGQPKPVELGLQGLWRTVLNVAANDPRPVEYLNGDRFDLRAANLRLTASPLP
jgi:hypothetical protein